VGRKQYIKNASNVKRILYDNIILFSVSFGGVGIGEGCKRAKKYCVTSWPRARLHHHKKYIILNNNNKCAYRRSNTRCFLPEDGVGVLHTNFG